MPLIKVYLESGNLAVYDAHESRLNEHPNMVRDIRQLCPQYAVRIGEVWYLRGGKQEITDRRTLDLINALPVIE